MRLLRSLFLLLGLFGADRARAETVRLPASGDPAFAFDVPAGWNVAYDQDGNLQIVASDKSSALQLSLPAETGNPSTSDLAAGILKAAGAQPYSATGTDTIAGKPADTFDAALVGNGASSACKVWIAKLDSRHYAVQLTLKQPTITAEQTAALEALIADVRFSGLQ
jgi:hypothetical protein